MDSERYSRGLATGGASEYNEKLYLTLRFPAVLPEGVFKYRKITRSSMKNHNMRKRTPYAAQQQTGNTWKGLLACIFLTGFVAFFLTNCSGKKAEPPKMMPAAPVTVDTVLKKSVPVQLHAIGNVEAYTTVGIKAQIGGTLAKVQTSS